MTSEEAKQILLLFRPHAADAQDAEVAAALEQTRRDPDLQRWFEAHCEAQKSLREKFSSLPVPPDLKDAILAGRRIIKPVLWWQQPAWLAAAATIVLLAGIAAFWLRPGPFESFSLFRSRMVSMALREYRMDIVTNDLTQIRGYLARRGAPAEYVIPAPLEQLKATGGGSIKWGTEQVSMVCFDRGDKQMLFLFIIDRSAIKGEPGRPKLTKISNLQTASWTEGTNTYLLAGPDDPEFLRKYGPKR